MPTASATIAPTASMAMTTRISTSDGGSEERVDALDLRLKQRVAENGNRAVDVDLFVYTHPAPASRIGLAHGDAHRLRQPPGAHSDHIDRLIGTEVVSRFQRGAIVSDHRRETPQRLEIVHLPGAHDLRPMRDEHMRRLAAARVVIVGGEEIETICFQAEGAVGERSEERRVGKEGRSRWSPYH